MDSLSNKDVDDDSLDCGNSCFYTLKNYYELNVGKRSDLTKIEQALAKLDAASVSLNNTKTDPPDYVISESGRFKVFYCDCGIDGCINPSTQYKAQAVADLFDDIDYLFCTQWGFLRPYYNSPTDDVYPIYIEEMEYDGLTVIEESVGSKIYIDPTIVNYIFHPRNDINYKERYKGVAAHEYMHAIMIRYGIMYETSDDQWLHESFATWAGIAFESDYAAMKTNVVNLFLDYPSKSLNFFQTYGIYQNRHYGACLFPLFLDQSWRGYIEIRKILETRSIYNDTLSAIDVSFSRIGRSLDEAYSNFTTWMYDPVYYYDDVPTIGEDAWSEAAKEPCSEYPASSSFTHVINPLASHFIEYQAPPNTCSTLTITVDYSSIPSGSRARLKTIRTNASGTHIEYTHTISNNRCTIVQQNFGSDTAKTMAFVAINAGTLGSISYTRSAELTSLYYTPGDGAQYSIKNVASGKYVNVHNGVDVNNTNVYQFTPDGTVEQNFLMERKTDGKYYIRALCSSNGTNRVLDIVKSGGSVISGGNVQIYTATDAVAQEWRFYHVGDGKYKIVPASNETVALTSYGTSNGSSSGRTATSAGNIFVSTYTESNNQLWTFVPIE